MAQTRDIVYQFAGLFGMACILVFLLGLVTTGLAASCDVASPIVLVPGILGNVIEAQLHKSSHSPHFFCAKDKDWYTLWLSISQLLPFEVDCLSENIELHYDPATKTYNNTKGVNIRVPGFGNTTSIEYLDPDAKDLSVTQYFHNLVQHFVDKGYVRGKTIVGAPYDWRFAPDWYLKQNYYANLQQLVEKAYANGGNKKVVLIAHSMGAPTSLYFLTKYVTQSWKDKYIKTLVTVSGVWHGAAKAAKAFVSGDNEGIYIDLPIWGRASQRSYPSTAWLLPYPSDTWTPYDILITTPTRNYTAWDYPTLFNDIKYPRGYDMFLEVRNLTGSLIPPNVTTFCYYGYNVPTAIQFKYTQGEFPDTEPEVVNGNGDGTVNLKSLLACERWAGQMPYNLTVKGYSDVEHVDTIRNADVIADIDNIVCNMKE